LALNVAVQMDPIERIKIAGDSTFAVLLEAQARGHKLFYYTPDRLSMLDGKIVAAAQSLQVRDSQGDHFTLGEIKRTDVLDFDVVLLRQDPPFDLAYITTTHLLERVHPKTLVVNDPASVRNAPEKMFVTEFTELMPPTLLSHDLDEIKAFRAAHGDIVMKPLYGKGGEAVFLLRKDDLNFGSLYDLFSTMFREQWVIQKFLPEVKQGDKRIILIDGEFAGAVNRVPAEGDLRSNMVRGGSPKSTDLSARAGNLQAARAGAEGARATVRRHRRDRRLADRDQCHLADRRACDQEFGRTGRGGDALGQHRGQAALTIPARGACLSRNRNFACGCRRFRVRAHWRPGGGH
jgi:glutathione synthase